MNNQIKQGFVQLTNKPNLFTQEKLAPTQMKNKHFHIGLPKEISLEENRIVLTPDSVQLLVNDGHSIWVESKAGERAKFTDKQYAEAGAKIIISREEIFSADIVFKINPPTIEEIDLMKKNSTLFSAIQLGNLSPNYIKELLNKSINAIAFEFLEDSAKEIPIIRAMSEIAGISIISIASEYLSNKNGGLGIVLGGITGVPPTKIVILGAGTVAEYVSRAAIGLGAEIKIFDNHLYKLRRIKQMLKQQIYTSAIDTMTLQDALKDADVVIGALRSENEKKRLIISEHMVSSMKPNSLIIDLTVDQGGCIATSKSTNLTSPTFKKHDVTHYCVPNIASRTAHTATIALSNIFTPIIRQASKQGGIEDMIIEHEWFMKGVYTYKKFVTNELIANKFNIKHKNLGLLMTARF